MREEDSNWFSKWEEELPSPDELMPISQTLITRDLALAFDIGNSSTTTTTTAIHHHHQQPPPPPPRQPNSAEFDSSSVELGGGGGSGSGGGLGGAADEPARTLKRPRLVWTPQLHKRFVDAVAHLGIKNAVPKTIMQLMSVDGLTRENVASHLQKYRLYLKRMQGLNTNGPGSSGPGGSGDPATDRLFASSPVPAHFLHQAGTGGGGGGGRPNSEHFMPYMPLHHQQMGVGHAHLQAQYPHRQLGHYGSGGAHFDQHLFVSRQAQAELGPSRNGMLQISGYVEDMESGTAADDRRKVLTLFPTGD